MNLYGQPENSLTQEALESIISSHAKWLLGEPGGQRADLREANLTLANLRAANLREANLRAANLRAANLREANLTLANLRAANLRAANLREANLRAANLRAANLREANLTLANLRAANLREANLRAANLTLANLRAANLRAANLSEANLREANLTLANLSEANLREANLTPIRDDIYAVLSSAPAEVAGLLQALREGRVDGSQYQGRCACLVGTLANVRGCRHDAIPDLQPDCRRASERFFMLINEGDTPATSQASKLAEEWISGWLNRMQSAFQPKEQEVPA